MKTFCFDAGCLKDSVESFAEVDGSGDFSVLVRDERAVFAEVKFFAEVFDHFDSCVVQWDVAPAGGTLEFADYHLSPTLRSDAVSLADLFYAELSKPRASSVLIPVFSMRM